MNKILIIIINNRNKMKMKFNTIIHTLKYEYKLLCCITESKEGKNFNIIIFNSKFIWYAIKNNENNKKEVGNDIGSLIQYPCVLFFEKGNKIISNNNNLNIMSVNKNILLDKNPGIMTNILDKQNILMKNNNHITHNKHNKHNLNANLNNFDVIMMKNNKQTIQNKHNLNDNHKVNKIIPQNNLINNHGPKININNNNNNQIIKKNEAIIKIKNDKHIVKMIGNNDANNIGIDNIFSNNMINDIKATNNNNFKNDIIKISQNMPNNQGYKNIQNNNIEKNNHKDCVTNEIAMNTFNSNDNNITLYFCFSNQKEIYLDVKETDYFSQVKKELYNKYSWLKNINIIGFVFNGANISENKTVKENGLKDNSQILIIER